MMAGEEERIQRSIVVFFDLTLVDSPAFSGEAV